LVIDWMILREAFLIVKPICNILWILIGCVIEQSCVCIVLFKFIHLLNISLCIALSLLAIGLIHLFFFLLSICLYPFYLFCIILNRFLCIFKDFLLSYINTMLYNIIISYSFWFVFLLIKVHHRVQWQSFALGWFVW
jgi:hypothetical protein